MRIRHASAKLIPGLTSCWVRPVSPVQKPLIVGTETYAQTDRKLLELLAVASAKESGGRPGFLVIRTEDDSAPALPRASRRKADMPWLAATCYDRACLRPRQGQIQCLDAEGDLEIITPIARLVGLTGSGRSRGFR